MAQLPTLILRIDEPSAFVRAWRDEFKHRSAVYRGQERPDLLSDVALRIEGPTGFSWTTRARVVANMPAGLGLELLEDPAKSPLADAYEYLRDNHGEPTATGYNMAPPSDDQARASGMTGVFRAMNARNIQELAPGAQVTTQLGPHESAAPNTGPLVNTAPPPAPTATDLPPPPDYRDEGSGVTGVFRKMDVSGLRSQPIGPKVSARHPKYRSMPRPKAGPLVSTDYMKAGTGYNVGSTEARSGSLDNKNAIRDLLLDLWRARSTGVLNLTHPDGLRTVYLKLGGPVGHNHQPPLPEESLGALLMKAGRIERDQLMKAQKQAKTRGGYVGETLVRMNVLTWDELQNALNAQLQYVLAKVLAVSEGFWYFEEHDRLPRDFITAPVDVEAFLIRREIKQLESMPRDEMLAMIDDLGPRYARARKGVTLRASHLSDKHEKAWEMLSEKPLRVNEFLSMSPLPRSKSMIFLLACERARLLAWSDRRDESFDQAAAADRLKRKHRSIGHNLFDRLEIHWSALDQEVEAGYRRMRDLYGPDVEEFRRDRELEAIREEVWSAVNEARSALAKAAGRIAHRKTVLEKGQMRLAAELFARQADTHAFCKEWKQVEECCARGLEIYPNNPFLKHLHDKARRELHGH